MLKKFSFLNIDYFKKGNNLKIDKDNEFINVDIEILPKFIKIKDKNLKKTIQKSVENFIITLSTNCKNFDLENFKNNFRTLKVVLGTIDDDNVRGKTVGRYDIVSNVLYIYELLSIYHELIHISSTKKVNSFISTGFALLKPGQCTINRYINEGYTQLLTERYFGFDPKNKSYEFTVGITRDLEKIIGQDRMEELYFKSDFMGVISD